MGKQEREMGIQKRWDGWRSAARVGVVALGCLIVAGCGDDESTRVLSTEANLRNVGPVLIVEVAVTVVLILAAAALAMSYPASKLSGVLKWGFAFVGLAVATGAVAVSGFASDDVYRSAFVFPFMLVSAVAYVLLFVGAIGLGNKVPSALNHVGRRLLVVPAAVAAVCGVYLLWSNRVISLTSMNLLLAMALLLAIAGLAAVRPAP